MAGVRALHLLALALLMGAFAFPLFVLRPSALGESERRIVGRWLVRLAFCSAVLALASWLAWLVLVTASMSGLPIAQALRPVMLGLVLRSTEFGHVWLLRVALMVLLLLACRRLQATWFGGVLAAALVVSQVGAGHAAAAPWTHMAVDAVHLVGAAVWVGSLLPLLLVLARARAREPAWIALAARAAHGFTAIGALAVAALALSGLVNARMMVGSVAALAGTTYGQLVATKIVLFAAMLALAAVNRFRHTPRLQPGAADAAVTAARFWRSVALEIALGVCALVVVGVLGGSEPPAHMPGDMPMHNAARDL